MKKVCVAILLLSLGFHLRAQEFKLDTLVFHGAAEKRINIVILGDGYLASQLSTFSKDARDLAAKILFTTPFEEYRNQFNVFAIRVASNVEGAGTSPANPIDNYFGSVFNFGGVARLLVPTKESKVTEVLASTFPLYDQVVMIVNSQTYGGSGGWVATCSKNAEGPDIVVHELGHSFASLADEYWAGEAAGREVANMTRQWSPQYIKWKGWLNEGGIGIIRHGTSSWYKPTSNACKMEALVHPFCAVCKEQIVRTIHRMSSPVDQYAHTISATDIQFDLTAIHPMDKTLKIKWSHNGEAVQNTTEKFSIRIADLGDDKNQIEAAIYDSTHFDRRDDYYLTTIKWNIASNMKGELQKSLLYKPRVEPITSLVQSEVSTAKISLFPNPVRNVLTVSYLLHRKTEVRFMIHNAEGKTVSQQTVKKPAGVHSQLLDLSNYPSDIYIVSVRIGNVNMQHRIVKQD